MVIDSLLTSVHDASNRSFKEKGEKGRRAGHSVDVQRKRGKKPKKMVKKGKKGKKNTRIFEYYSCLFSNVRK